MTENNVVNDKNSSDSPQISNDDTIMDIDVDDDKTEIEREQDDDDTVAEKEELEKPSEQTVRILPKDKLKSIKKRNSHKHKVSQEQHRIVLSGIKDRIKETESHKQVNSPDMNDTRKQAEMDLLEKYATDRAPDKPNEYMLEIKMPMKISYSTSPNGSKFEEVTMGMQMRSLTPIVNNDKPVTTITEEERRLYNLFSATRLLNHEPSLDDPMGISFDRMKYMVKFFMAIRNNKSDIKDCIFGLCTLRRLNYLCKTLTIGKRYMFVFRLNKEYIRYVSFTIVKKEKSCHRLNSGVIMKLYNVTTHDGSLIVFSVFDKRVNGVVQVTDNLFNQIDFNFGSYMKVTGDMSFVTTTHDNTVSFKLDELYVMTF